eukprot:UN19276
MVSSVYIVWLERQFQRAIIISSKRHALWHFKKSIHFREKYTMKCPQMKGWTVCGVLKTYSL